MNEQQPIQAPPDAAAHAKAPMPLAPTTAPVTAGQLQPVVGSGPVGKIRGTGVCILLSVITFGIYCLVWYYKTHEEMKQHTGNGLGGGLALVLAIFVGFVMPFITAAETGSMYRRAGQRPPVSGATGLWVIPGAILIVGPLVWFIKTNGALNAYWRSLGAR
jgi:hypothetical protein